MNNTVSTAWLAENIENPDLFIADVRWVNGEFEGGLKLYNDGHIPGAVFVDLDTVLSDRSDLSRGRHPLPNPDAFAENLANLGIGNRSFIVAYDDVGGSVASRLWWMMRWVGIANIVVLDGGITKWTVEGRKLEKDSSQAIERTNDPIKPQINSAMHVERHELEKKTNGRLLIDARASERYLGEVEPIDSRAGHIPGAMNIPFAENMTETEPQVFRSSEELRDLYEQAGINKNSNVVCYCGSGVTACHNLLALNIAGFTTAKLYPGSWSEWICHHDAE